MTLVKEIICTTESKREASINYDYYHPPDLGHIIFTASLSCISSGRLTKD